MAARRVPILLIAAAACQTSFGANAPSDQLKDYLVDIGPGPVSAADLIGVSASAVTNVQNLKDFNVLLSPAAGSDQKTGLGLQITPGRTQWSPISAQQYVDSAGARFLASLSLSYAQNKATYGTADYRQQAAALHAAYYFDKNDDPVVAAHEAFGNCTSLTSIELGKADQLLALMKTAKDELNRDRPPGEPERQLSPEARARIAADYNASAQFARLAADADAAVVECVAKGARAKWNAPLLTATLGDAWIRPDNGGRNLSLGKSLAIAAVLPAGADGALNLLVRLGRRELDLDTLAGAAAYKSHTLLAGRYTYRGNSDSKLFGLAEVSNAKDSSGATVSSTAFKYALGVDAKVLDFAWLEFRVGRARSNTGSGEETKALLGLKWSTESSLPSLFAKK